MANKRYTKEELIKILQEKTKELKRAPMVKELSKQCFNEIISYFGSLNNALKTSNIKINREKKYTKEQCIKILQEKTKELGHTPKSTDILNYKTIINHFGTWNEALIAVGLEINKKRGYTKKELIIILQQKAKELKRTPKSTDIKQLSPIYKHFGDFNNALKEAGFL